MGLTLKVSDIGKNYGGNEILKDCSFIFEEGGTYVLMGPNGSGKSTFLRICALLEAPDRGEVGYSSGGAVLRNDTSLRRRMTLVLPQVGIFNTTVFGNVAYGLKIRGMEIPELRRRVDGALGAVNLRGKSGQNALTLSSGEARRLGIARALAVEPEVLFLDEPTAYVDRQSRAIIEDKVLEIKRSGKVTIIVTTHDSKQAERLGDSLLVMEEGKIG